MQHKNIDTISDVSMYGHHKKLETPRKLSSRKSPLKMLYKWAGYSINGEMGELIKYHNLRKTQSTDMHEEYSLEMKSSAFPKEWKAVSRSQTQCTS